MNVFTLFRAPEIPAISENAKRRASEADPNTQRCLVENCPKERAVEITHVFPREFSGERYTLDALEWSWGMRKGTLNLDTRRNMFFLGASLKALYQQGKWCLLPKTSIIDQYFTEADMPRRRELPDISDDTYEYTFFPLYGMESFGITRQTEHPPTESGFTNHVYPFTTLPTLTSHVHPKFALYHLGRLIYRSIVPDEAREKLLQSHPGLLERIVRLYSIWSALPPRGRAEKDPSYVTLPEPGMDEDMSEESYLDSEGDSVCTAPRRLPFPEIMINGKRRSRKDKDSHARQAVRKFYTASEADGRRTPPRRIIFPDETALGKRRSRQDEESDARSGVRQCTLTRKVLANSQKEEEEDTRWTKESISSWARECSIPPESGGSSVPDPIQPLP